jgi:hypothetical protein
VVADWVCQVFVQLIKHHGRGRLLLGERADPAHRIVMVGESGRGLFNERNGFYGHRSESRWRDRRPETLLPFGEIGKVVRFQPAPNLQALAVTGL